MTPSPEQILNTIIPRWKQIYHKFKALRSVPFRKQFFVGYDLSGNTYWEFKLENSSHHLRRKLIPSKRQNFLVDYFSTVPPQWHQWLRYTRENAPSIKELLEDQERLRILKQNSKIIDTNWKNLTAHQQLVHEHELAKELQNLESKEGKN